MISHTYGEKPADFRAGDRVELHPGCDLWMRGARFGTVTKVGRKFVTVKMDHWQIKRQIRFAAHLLRSID
jgi:hypothetical protein